MKKTEIKGWWFAHKNKKLANGDNREIKIGTTHRVKGEIIPCDNGLHLSQRLLDALNYAPGPVVYEVIGSGTIKPHGKPTDKYACSERTYISGGVDASDVLFKFARMCALDVVHLWPAPKVVVNYLKTGDPKLRDAAGAAAGAAAGDAAWSAARATAGAAAWYAARDAARAATWYAAWDAARAAARDAARAAAWTAARDAARDAARAVARKRQNRRLTYLIKKEIGKGGQK